MKLRLKILGGFVILASILLIAAAWSIIEVQSFGTSLQQMLENNYKSIYAAKSMKEALEREDSALLLLLMGNDEHSTRILFAADSLFTTNYEVAKSNITISCEDKLVNSIERKYSLYKQAWSQPLNKSITSNRLDWYFQNSHEYFLDVMKSIDEVSSLNDSQLYTTAMQISQRSHRALMPGVIALIATIVFTILFNYFISLYVVTPIVEITKRIKNFNKNRTPFDYHVQTKDEISKLTDTLNILCTNIVAEESDQ